MYRLLLGSCTALRKLLDAATRAALCIKLVAAARQSAADMVVGVWAGLETFAVS